MAPRRNSGFSQVVDAEGWGHFDVAWIWSSVEGTGTATRWRDESGHGNHGVPSGSPAIDTSQTFGSGIVFDGVNDLINCTLASAIASDQPCTVWILHKPDSVTPGGRSGILELGKTGAGNESLWIHTSFGSIVARERADDLGDSDATTDLQLLRVESTRFSRSIYRNGVLRGSSGVDTSPGVEVTKIRMGNRLAGDVSQFDGSAFAMLIKFGGVTEAEARATDRKLMLKAGISLPYDYASIPAASITTGDPRFLLPAVTHCLVGYPLMFDMMSVGYRNGRVSRVVTSDLPLNQIPEGRAVVVPKEAGSYSLTIREGEYSASTTLIAHEVPASLAVPVEVFPFGNSQMHRAQSGFLQFCRTVLGAANFSTVGSIAAPPGFDCDAEGRDSWVMSETARALGAKGCFDGTSGDDGPSPYYSGGVLNMAAYFAGISVDPLTVTDVWCWGFQNAGYLSNAGNIEATLAAEVEATVRIFAAMAAIMAPGVRFRLFTEFPLEAEPKALTWGSWAQSTLFHEKAHRAAEVIRTVPDHAGLAGLNVRVIPTFHHVGVGAGYRSGWADSIHLNAGPGHEALLSPVLGDVLSDVA